MSDTTDLLTNETTIEQVIEPVVEHAAEPVVEHAAEQVVEHAAEQGVEHAAEQGVEQAAEQGVEQISENAVDKNVESALENAFENIVDKSLTSLIIRCKLMKTSVSLTPELIDIIEKIMSHTPDVFSEIEKAVVEIVKDGKIDSKDIPHFIIVVQKVYQVIYSLKNTKLDSKKRSEITASVLKYIVHLMVLEGKLTIEEERRAEFLKDADILIDSCIGLLSFPKAIKTKGCIKKLFG